MIHKYSYGKGYSTVDIEVYEKELTIKKLQEAFVIYYQSCFQGALIAS